MFLPLTHPRNRLGFDGLNLCSIIALTALCACTSSPIDLSVRSATPEYNTSLYAQRSDTLSADKAQSLAVYALGLVGTPYKWGGNTPESGFDCSGLIAYIYQNQTGIKSPRTVADLYKWGQEVPRSQVRTGDILVFGSPLKPTHAGIYVGEERFVHAPSTGGTVKLSRLDTAYWRGKELSIRRPQAR
jgi:cell wall-associated NlpC family hydrolase